MNRDGAVLLGNNANAAEASARFAGRQIRNYTGHGSWNRWRYHPALRRGIFNRWDAYAMQRDNACLMGLLALMSPFPGVNYEVRANSREIKTFIENTLHRFWSHDLQKVLLHYIPHGTCVAEVLYDQDLDSGLWKYAGLDDFQLDEVQALRHGRVLTGARISHGSALLTGQYMPNDQGQMPNELRPPKLFWCARRALCGDLFGQSVFEAAWDPWMEKVGAHGALDIRKLWAFTCAFRGAIIVYPPGGNYINGVYVDNQDVAREIGEKYATGATMTMPFEPDEKTGENMWDIKDPVMNGQIEGLLKYPSDLSEEIWQGMGVPAEAIRSLDAQGWGNAKGVPMLLLLNGVDLLVREVMTAFDVGPGGYTSRSEQSGGVIRPLVMQNFGGKARYEIRVFPLVPKAQAPGATGPGGAPPSPGGAPPGGPAPAPGPIPGAGSAPIPGVGGKAIGLSQASAGGVEVANGLVSKILGRELPASASLSAAFDESKHHRGQPGNAGEFGSGGAPAASVPAAPAPTPAAAPAPPPKPSSSAKVALKRMGTNFKEVMDKVPGAKWMRTKLAKINDKLTERYGRKQALAIVASGQAVGWGATIVGTAVTGVPVYIPFSTVIGMVPGAALAELHYQLSGKKQKAAVAMSAAEPEQLTPEQIHALGAKLVKKLMKLWKNRESDPGFSEGVSLSAHDVSGESRDDSGEWTASSESLPTYEQAARIRDKAEAASKEATAVLYAIPGYGSAGAGLTPDHVKALPAYQRARAASSAAFERSRKINAWMAKTFKREEADARKLRQAARQKAADERQRAAGATSLSAAQHANLPEALRLPVKAARLACKDAYDDADGSHLQKMAQAILEASGPSDGMPAASLTYLALSKADNPLGVLRSVGSAVSAALARRKAKVVEELEPPKKPATRPLEPVSESPAPVALSAVSPSPQPSNMRRRILRRLRKEMDKRDRAAEVASLRAEIRGPKEPGESSVDKALTLLATIAAQQLAKPVHSGESSVDKALTLLASIAAQQLAAPLPVPGVVVNLPEHLVQAPPPATIVVNVKAAPKQNARLVRDDDGTAQGIEYQPEKE